jgi:hypothetical protein
MLLYRAFIAFNLQMLWCVFLLLCVCLSVFMLTVAESWRSSPHRMFLSPLLFQALLVYSFALFKFFQNSCPFLVPNGLHFQPLISFLGMSGENE